MKIYNIADNMKLKRDNKYSILSWNTFIGMLIVIGFICSAPLFAYNLNILRIVQVSLVFLVGVQFSIKIYNNPITYSYVVFNLMLITLLLFQIFLYQLEITYSADSLWLYTTPLLAGIIFFNGYDLRPLIKGFLIVLLFSMLYEIYLGHYLFYTDSASVTVLGRWKGLFEGPKTVGVFSISAVLYLRFFDRKRYLPYAIIALCCSLLSMTRTAVLFIAPVIILDSLFFYRRLITKRLFFGCLVVFAIFIVILGTYSDFTHLLNSFNMHSTSQLQRVHFWSLYWHSILNRDEFSFLFGNPNYLNSVIGNGAESGYLNVLSDTGLVGFVLIYTVPFWVALKSLCSMNDFKLYYPFLLLLPFVQVGRLMLGYADGLLYWVCLFYIVFDKNYLFSKGVKL